LFLKQKKQTNTHRDTLLSNIVGYDPFLFHVNLVFTFVINLYNHLML
jgi:hypothetical protein